MEAHQPSPAPPSYESLAKQIEHHALRPEFTDTDIAEACRLARAYGIAALVVRPSDVDVAVRWLAGSDVVVASVAGYPDGSSATGTKLYEGRDLLRRGAREIDFVVSPGKLLSREYQHVEMELLQMANSCREAGALMKVLLRNELLDADAKAVATKIAKRVQAGMISVAAEFDFFRPLLKDRIAMKALGAADLPEALACQVAGCTRIGTESTPAILDAWRAHLATLQPEAQPDAAAPSS